MPNKTTPPPHRDEDTGYGKDLHFYLCIAVGYCLVFMLFWFCLLAKEFFDQPGQDTLTEFLKFAGGQLGVGALYFTVLFWGYKNLPAVLAKAFAGYACALVCLGAAMGAFSGVQQLLAGKGWLCLGGSLAVLALAFWALWLLLFRRKKAKPALRYCPYCGAALEAPGAFCPYCGKPMGGPS